ncbi:MAG TPA: cytochrome c [Candidatus Kryptonia bacterium]|nr:cytochrome c [Candidatus Kryptonia bacterium]
MMGRGAMIVGCVLWWASVALAGNATGDASKGKPLYLARCSFCHGPAGRGDGPAGAALKPPPTNFANADFWKSADLNRLRLVLKNGKPGTPMPPSQLAPEEIDDVLAYLRTFAD